MRKAILAITLLFIGLFVVFVPQQEKALATASGEKVWEYLISAETYASAAPSVIDGYVYVGSGKVYCLTESTGQIVWSFSTGGGVGSPPTYYNGRLYFGSSDNKIYCLDATTGTKIWEFLTDGDVYGSPVIVNSKLYVGSEDTKFYCLDITTGTKIWVFSSLGKITATPCYANGNVFVGSQDKNIYSINAETGLKNWSFTAGNVFNWCAAVYSSGNIYIGCEDTKVYCISASTGQKIWEYATGGWVRQTPAVSDKYVYAGGQSNKLFCLDKFTGTKIWEYSLGCWSASHPAYSNGYVYLGTYDNRVLCLDGISGAKNWEYSAGATASENTPVIANGKIFFASNNKKVYCLSAPESDSIGKYWPTFHQNNERTGSHTSTSTNITPNTPTATPTTTPEPATVHFTTTTLTSGVIGTPYSVQLSASGGTAPYKYIVFMTSALPKGFTLSLTGLLSGTPTEAFQGEVELMVSDATGAYERKKFTMSITSGSTPTTNTPTPTPPTTDDDGGLKLRCVKNGIQISEAFPGDTFSVQVKVQPVSASSGGLREGDASDGYVAVYSDKHKWEMYMAFDQMGNPLFKTNPSKVASNWKIAKFDWVDITRISIPDGDDYYIGSFVFKGYLCPANADHKSVQASTYNLKISTKGTSASSGN